MKFEPRSSSHSRSAIASRLVMVTLIAIAIVGFELVRSAHAFRFLWALLTVLLLAVIAFSIEHFTRYELSSDVAEAHHRLRMAMAYGKSVGWDADLNRGRLEWFGDLQNMFGIASHTFTATPDDFYQYVHPADRQHVSELVAQARDLRNLYSTEFRIVRPDGVLRWVNASGRFYYKANGQPERMLGIAVDITDRKRIEEALIQSEQKFSKAFRKSPMAVTLTNARDHRYLDVNEAFLRITGWTREEVIGRTPFDLAIWVNPREAEPFERDALANQSIQNFEIHFRSRDGEQRVGLGSGEVIEIDGNECILSVIVDITDRKRAEQALLRKESELADAQKLAHMGSWQWDPQTEKLTWSEELYALFGADSRLPPPSVEELSKRFSPESWRLLRDIMAEGVKDGSVRDLDIEVMRPDGTKRWIYTRGQVVRDKAGTLVTFGGTAQDITERKRMEERLHASELRLAGIVDSALDAIIATDAEERTVLFNPAAEKMFACSANEAVGSPLSRFIAIPASLIQAQTSQTINPDVVTHSLGVDTLRGIRSNGEKFPVEASISRIDINHERLCTVIVRDITERNRAESALRESEEQFRRVVEHIGDALVVDDQEGHVVFANDRFLRLFGLEREELPNIDFGDYVAPEYREEVEERDRRRMQGQLEESHFEYQGIRRDGTRLWVEAKIVPIKNQKGELIGTQKLLRDTTERKRADQLLRESEERFRLVANSAPVMIWMSGTDKLYTYFNNQRLEFTGRPLHAELGNGWTEGIHIEDLAECLKAYTEAFDARKRFEMQYRLRRFDGEYRWIFDTGVPRFNPDGSFAGYIGSCMDMTEQRAAQEALTNMGRKLMDAHEEERTWIARELHDDINQQLALTAVELDRWAHNASSLEADPHIRRARARIMEIAKDVQALSHRLHSSKLEYLGLVAAAKSFCKEFAEQNKVQVHFTSENVPRMLPQDTSLCLFRVLQEALQNAVKHSGVQEFWATLNGTAETVELRVSDRGRGFDEQQALAHRGLGLISMRERLQFVSGELSIRSKPGVGTTVYAHVPFKVEESRALAG
jgi:PAS domain S-box-containing protein